jgi:cell division protease FtsH
MVKEYGMSKEVGQIYFERERKQSFLDMTAPSGKDYSESTAQTIDSEVKKIIDSQYEVASKTLNEHKQVLDEGAALLLKEENIEGNRLKALLDGKKA